MPTTKETAKAELEKLVIRFREQYASYKQASYSEALVRKDFIDPFFKLLGWDMDNNQGYAEAYREVIHEDRVKVGKALKAPDYSFRLPGGKRLFFVEAKKPFVKVKTDVEPAYQVRRYAWSAKLPVSILTDFEEFSVYDCTKRPEVKDSASKARIKYLTFEQYLPEFDFLWETFSKEQVLKGSFDRYLKSDAHKRGTSTVDDAFLQSLDNWRAYLATSISIRNRHLDEEAINFVVQHTIDRLIFLRIAEDRGVEPYGQLKAILKEKGDHYPKLFEIFQRADDRYNSGLFDFKKDEVSEGITVDNKVVKTIVEELYYPESPYEFSVISVEILGSAYEQFLGKQIRIDSGHRARIEEKPEVRHAGGVYYTPQYIVEYIVERTVGELVKGKKPAEVETLRIVDPACGSGSFLLGAYQYLLNWHKEQYGALKKMRTGKKSDKLRPDGELTTAEKKRILVNNIHGVDLDANAVEVTKLSLLLKCMEGETEASISQQLGLFHERVLPTLDKNVQCGNSLIDTDWYDMHPDGDAKAVKPFNWERGFPEVFKKGGFDAVIGNPPYIRVQVLQNYEGIVPYLSSRYQSAHKGNYDIYVAFIEKALAIVSKAGKVGYILPHKFFTAVYGEQVRELLKKERAIESVIHFGAEQVFQGATTYTCIMLLNKSSSAKQFRFTRIDDLKKWNKAPFEEKQFVKYADLQEEGWTFVTGTTRILFDKLSKIETKLEDVTDRIFQGIKTSADKIYIVNLVRELKDHLVIHCPMDEQEYKVEKGLFHPLVKGGDSRGFVLADPDRRILFPYGAGPDNKVALLTWKKLSADYPSTAQYLLKHRRYLTARENNAFANSSWYRFGRSQALEVMERRKLFTPEIAPKASFALDPTGKAFFTGGVAGGYGLLASSGYSDIYLLGLLNSKLLNWYVERVSTQMRGGWYSFESKYIKQLPIVRGTAAQQKAIIEQVVRIVELNSSAAKGDAQTMRRIEHHEERLNALVYGLYGITKEEVGVVEGKLMGMTP